MTSFFLTRILQNFARCFHYAYIYEAHMGMIDRKRLDRLRCPVKLIFSTGNILTFDQLIRQSFCLFWHSTFLHFKALKNRHFDFLTFRISFSASTGYLHIMGASSMFSSISSNVYFLSQIFLIRAEFSTYIFRILLKTIDKILQFFA